MINKKNSMVEFKINSILEYKIMAMLDDYFKLYPEEYRSMRKLISPVIEKKSNIQNDILKNDILYVIINNFDLSDEEIGKVDRILGEIIKKANEEFVTWCHIHYDGRIQNISEEEKPLSENVGYHFNTIEKGIFGDSSKIREELEEFEDALEQGSSIMALVELSDLYGAIEGYIDKHYPGITMDDIKKFSLITKRVFKNGQR